MENLLYPELRAYGREDRPPRRHQPATPCLSLAFSRSRTACRRILRGSSRMAPAVDENTGQVGGGGVAANDGVDVDALLEARIEDRFAGRTPPRLWTLENL